MGNQNWGTPWGLFYKLDRHFHFTLDGAADTTNFKVANYYGLDNGRDAFTQSPYKEVIFCNPPYNNMMPWAELFVRWAVDNVVVALTQDKTDTAWFKYLWEHSMQVQFLHKRIAFIGTKTSNMHGATIFLPVNIRFRGLVVGIWDWQNEEW